MSDLAKRLAGLSPAQRQLLEKRLAQQNAPTAEPIAIVGMACRFPGAPNLDSYWRLIRDGVNASREVPADRWNADDYYDPTGETPGKMSVRWAALIDKPQEFDPQFFGITPREAMRMDPQQRLLLEVAWEAMENAGLPADQLAGTRTGVYVGIGGSDYSKLCVPYEEYFQIIDAHMGTGNALSIAANRLSYIFDFHGPSAAVDTACSSSSLAIHFAVESLRRRESDAALAGGVNMILTPETTIAFSKARMLSPDGVCRPFDAAANGYVRGEGCGLVLLKRLADAERDGDHVVAVLRATSVNQDGRTSGISAPNSQSQVACIRGALRQAGMTPDDISYVEAHGTGTPLGDPIEMQALCEVFCATDEAGPPVYVSSVKANVGHMETVSGVAGLIKVALLMEHEALAPQTHFTTLNPHINLAGTRLVIPTEPVSWPSDGRRRIAGVSSFGFGGTNTHLIVEAPPVQTIVSSTEADRPVQVLKLSAKTDTALAVQAEQIAAYLTEHESVLSADVCYSLNTGRADFNSRAAFVAKDGQQLRDQLAAFATGKRVAGVKQEMVRTLGRPKVGFLFTGQGLQYQGMGRGLYESHPIFRDAIDKCDGILRKIWKGQSLVSILYPEDKAVDDPNALIHQTEYTQPALFSLEYALAELWQSWGVAPDIVLGHSVGEYAAACAAGVMTVEDGLSLIAERARLMQGVKRCGKMAVVFAPPEKISEAVARTGGRAVIAVLNGPENTVISGEAAAIESLAEEFTAAGIQVKLLNVSHAFHSPLMEEMLDEFEQFAGRIEFHAPQVPLAANLTGQLLTEAPTARYWRDHLRNTVRFSEGMARVAEAEPTVLIEIGPTASLLGMGKRCVPKLDAVWLPSLRQGQDDWQTLVTSVADYYVRGGQIDWRGWDRPWPRRRLTLPTYPFERARHWFTLESMQRRSFSGENVAASGTASGNPLLGTRLSTVWSSTLFEVSLSARSPAYLADHQVQGSAVAPAAAYIEQGLAAAEQSFGPGRHGLANLVIQQAMFLPEGTRRRVQVSVSPESGGEAMFETHSRPAESENASAPWIMHATGTLTHESHNSPKEAATFELDSLREQTTIHITHDEFYSLVSDRGLAYGPAFRMLHDLNRGEKDAVSRVELPESIVREAGRYCVHPVLGDALLQSMACVVPLERDGSFSPFTYMPVGIGRVRVGRPIDDFRQPLFTYATRTSLDSSPSPERVVGDVFLVNAAGETLVAFEDVQVQRLGRSGSVNGTTDTSRWLYRVGWREQSLGEVAASAGQSAGAWLIFADERGIGADLAARFAGRGEKSVIAKVGKRFQTKPGSSGNGKPGGHVTATLDPLDANYYVQLIKELFVDKEQRCLGVVHLWSLDIPPAESTPDAWDRSRALGSGSAMQLLRALARTTLRHAPPVWFVTAGAQAVELDEGPAGSQIAVEQSPLLGLSRVAAMELPDLRTRLVDLDASDLAAEQLFAEIVAGANGSEVAYRNGRRYVARLLRDGAILSESKDTGGALTVPAGRSFQLRITQAGSFDALRFAPVDRERPGVGQVELEVRATGLNFSDVLKALGLYPGIKDAIVPLGIEASGIVTAVGEGVTRFRVGDEVLGVVPYAFASHALTAEYALVHKPKTVDHDEACTIPITFLTAYYALVRLAQLQPGERLLIHAGAGGVGLAAIQIAQQIGAEIYATAGSDEKHEFLRSLGVKHVYSSRSTVFAEEILADTDRQGVDVVLNSLPGEAITKSLSILRAYGRFLEIGKTDIYQNRMIGLLPFQDNLSYSAIDLDRMLRQRPEYIRQLFAEVMEHFESGHYRPLMFTRFEAERTIDAFRYMSQRKNIGKVIVAFENHPSQGSSGKSRVPEVESNAARVRGEGTYLITGGLGALGLQVGEWLAGGGAGTIALLSRRPPSAESELRLDAIRKHSAQVVTIQGDVADAKSLRAALAQLPAECPPLVGVVHAAGVLADGILADMTLEQLDRAMEPKVQGAWNLHVAMREKQLDFFVMFSSVASVLGSPGQANYAAGNAMLDALAHARRAAGLPATTVNWGPWAGAGMAAEAGRTENVKSRGMIPIAPELGLDVLGKLLRADAAQVAVMDVQWGDLLTLLGSRRPELLAEVAAEVHDSTPATKGDRVDHAFRKRLFDSNDETRQLLVRDYIRDELAKIIGVAPESLDAERPVSTFGMDSLLALELKNNLESRLDFTLPMARLMEGPSITSLAQETVRLVIGETSAGEGDAIAKPNTGAGSATAPEEWSPLVAIRETGSRPPLIFMPPLGGDARCYADLADELGGDQPMYTFRPRGADQDLPPHDSMDEMIAAYAAAVRAIQPKGPYYVGGWSTGGIYAFALGEALERRGEELAAVMLFDAPLPTICDNVDFNDDSRFLCDLVNFANGFAGTSIRVDYDELRALPQVERFQSMLAEARRQGAVPAAAPEAYIRRLIQVGRANVRAIQNYHPRPLKAPVQFFLPTSKGGLAEIAGPEFAEEGDHGWSAEVGQPMTLHEVPGDHFTMMVGEGAASIARRLTPLLTTARASRPRRAGAHSP